MNLTIGKYKQTIKEINKSVLNKKIINNNYKLYILKKKYNKIICKFKKSYCKDKKHYV